MCFSSFRRFAGRTLAGLAAAAAFASAANAAVSYNIVTGAETGTYFQFGKDLAKFVSPSAGISLNVVPTAGSVENIKRLRDEAGTKLALVQSDVFQAYLDEAANGNAAAARIVAPLRVIVPMYEEEIYVVVRADSPLRYIHEIHGKKINVGPVGSGSAMTAATLYRRLFFSEIPRDNMSTVTHDAALDRLAKGAIDVAIIVAGQPAAVLKNLPPQQAKQLRFLSLRPDTPNLKSVLQVYDGAKVKASSYPNMLDADVDSLAVRTLLVTYEYKSDETRENLTKFARAMCKSMGSLKTSGHDKWKQVDFKAEALKDNWSYFGPTEEELKGCRNGEFSTPAPLSTSCSQQEQLMGICRRT